MNDNYPAKRTGPPGKPVLPPQAEAEILERLFTNMKISSGEIAAILEKYDVRGSEPALQAGYRKRLGQRLMASIRDENGKREVLAHRGEYVVVGGCNDRQTLKAIQYRLQSQVNGLTVSAAKAQGRADWLERFLRRFRRAG